MDYFKRNRRQIAATTVAGVAGAAAAYYAYNWWYTRPDDHEEEYHRNPLWPYAGAEVQGHEDSESFYTASPERSCESSPDGAAAGPANSATTDGTAAGPDEVAEMAAHFRRIQEVFGGGSEQQVAALARQLRTAVDVDSIKTRLQRLRGQTAGATKERKEALWRDLAVAEFTLAVAAAWLAPLPLLTQRAQGNIIARRIFLQTNIQQDLCALTLTLIAILTPPEQLLTPLRQQRFMATPGGLRPADVVAVVNSVSAVVRTALEPVSLGDPLRADDALELLSNMHSGVEAAAIDWAQLALPAEVVAAVSRDGVNGDMVLELQALLYSAVFERALKAAGQAAAKLQAEHLRAVMGNVGAGTGDWWLAKLAPKMDGAAGLLLDDGATLLASSIQDTTAVHALALQAYSGFSTRAGAAT